MFPAKALLTFAALAISAASATPLAASPLATLSFAASFNASASGHASLADADRARAKALHANGLRAASVDTRDEDRKATSFSVTNAATIYTAKVGVGSPATDYTLLIDTGSSNTWIGVDKKYKKTKTSKSTGNSVKVSYGSGSMSGTEYTDTVTLSKALVIEKQSIGVAKTTQGFGKSIDGILGIGPVDLTASTVDSTSKVPTVTDNLAKAGTIKSNSIGIYYVPASEKSSDGELTFGGPDTSKVVGSVDYVPITSTSPASKYWGIDQTISYGGKSILDKTSGIVDTGTTLVLLATDAFNAYKKATGGTEDSSTGLLKITSAQYKALKDLEFSIGGKSYPLNANAQIWPRALNSQIGGDKDAIYLVVADMGQVGGQGLDFINGYAWLERYYSVYDTDKKQVGFGKTQYTDAKDN